MFEYLPQYILKELKPYGLDNINEIRIRQNTNVSIIVNGKSYTLNVLVKSQKDVEEIVFNACKRSIYSYDEDIKNGFITTDSGERIGLAGEFVVVSREVVAIRKFSSLVVRIPKEVDGFCKDFYQKYYIGKNLLVFSKPGAGKTTFIRDLIKELSLNGKGNIVVIDERNEICANTSNLPFELGGKVDVLTYATKSYGFNQAIRTLNPDFIVTDELMCSDDAIGVLRAVYGGISVIATVHASSLEDLKGISYLKELLNNKVFDNYLLIENELGNRALTIFDKDFNEICSY